MNSALAILGAIAAIFATIGYLLLGKPKGEDTRSVQPTERVQPETPETIASAALPEPPVSEPLPEQTYGEVGGMASDRVTNGATNGITLDTVEQPDAIDGDTNPSGTPSETPIELNLDDATQVNELEMPIEALSDRSLELQEFSEPRSLTRGQSTSGMAAARYSPGAPIQQSMFSVLHDPKRPPTLALQKLSQQILTWGEAKTHESDIIDLAPHENALIRQCVATALTTIAAPPQVPSAIPVVMATLNALSQDHDEKVRAIAQSGLVA